jgi:hypothetical protein
MATAAGEGAERKKEKERERKKEKIAVIQVQTILQDLSRCPGLCCMSVCHQFGL